MHMHRLISTPLRTFVALFVFICAAFAVPTTAQADDTLPFTVSTDSEDHWYFIEVTRQRTDVAYYNQYPVIGYSGTAAEGTALTACKASRVDANRWKFVAADNEGEYYLVSKSGLYATYSSEANTQAITLTAEKTSAKTFKVSTCAASGFSSSYMITGSAGTFSFNCWGGSNVGNPIKFHSTTDGGGAVRFVADEGTFDTAVTEETNMQFLGNGKQYSLHVDDSGALSGVAVSGTLPTDDGDEWQFYVSENYMFGYVLKSKSGYYITYDSSTRSVSTTKDVTAAATFLRQTNSYNSNTNAALENLKIIGGPALGIDADGNVIAADENSTSSLAYYSSTTFPVEESTPAYVQFIAMGNFALYDNGTTVTPATFKEADVSTTEAGYKWSFVTNARNFTVYSLKSDRGNYLVYDAAAGTFTSSSDASQATAFTRTNNQYNTDNNATRETIVFADGSGYLGVNKDEELAVVAGINSRYAATRINETAMVLTRMPRLSTEKKGTFAYTMATTYDLLNTNRATWTYHDMNYADGESNPKIQRIAGDNPGALWVFEDAGQNDGRVYIKNLTTGKYLTVHSSNGRYISCDKASSHVFKIFEMVDYSNTNYQPYLIIYDQSNSKRLLPYTSGADLGFGSNLGVDERLLIEPASYNSTTAAYFYAPYAMNTLYDGAGTSPSACVKTDAQADEGHKWQLVYNDDGTAKVKSANGNYLTCSDDGTFGVSSEADAAYSFALAYHTLTSASDASSFQLLKTDGSQALLFGADGSLSWGAKNAVLAYVIATTTYPSISEQYMQFAGNGRYVLTDNGTGTAVSVTLIGSDVTTPEGTQYKWTYASNAASTVIKSGDNNYLVYDASNSQFTTSSSADDATLFVLSTNSFFSANDLARYNVTLFTDATKTLGVKNGKVITTAANSRYAIVRFCDAISGINAPFVSEEGGKTYWYMANQVVRNGKLYDDGYGSYLKFHEGTADKEVGPSDRWAFYEADANGTFYMMSSLGHYITLNSPHQVLTADKSNARAYKLVEWAGSTNHTGWVNYYFLYDTSANNYISPYTTTSTGDENYRRVGYGGGQHDERRYYFTPVVEEPCYVIFTNKKAKALKSNGADEAPSVGTDMDNLKEKNSFQIVMTTDYKLLLKDSAGRYLSYTTDGGFAMVTDSASAYAFTVKESIKEYNDSLVDYCLINTEGTQALSMSGDGSTLTWGTIGRSAGTVVFVKELSDTQYGYNEAEDYTAYRILPKRSWFVYQASKDTEEANDDGMVNEQENGTYDPAYGWSTHTLEDGTSHNQQKTNVYEAVHYMKRGTSRDILLPTIMSGVNSRVNRYQRWYEYETDSLIPEDIVMFQQEGNANINARRNYANGTVMGHYLPLNGQSSGDWLKRGFNFTLPTDVDHFTVALDASLYTDWVKYFDEDNSGTVPAFKEYAIDGSNAETGASSMPENADLIEPTLTGRYLFRFYDANIIAQKLLDCKTNNTWLEERTIAFPYKKVNLANPSVPLEMKLIDYWVYNGGVAGEDNLQNITTYSRIKAVLEDNTAGISLLETFVDGAGSTSSSVSNCRFITFSYPDAAGTGVADATGYGIVKGDHAVLKIYAVDDSGNEYPLSRIRLNFVEETEPRYYEDIIGFKDGVEGQYKTVRSPEYMRRKYGSAKASISFDFDSWKPYRFPPVGQSGMGNAEDNSYAPAHEHKNTYRYPVQYDYTNYAFEPVGNEPEKGNSTYVEQNTWGSYTIAHRMRVPWGNNALFNPIRTLYKEAYANTSYADDEGYKDDNAGLMYIDASEEPGTICALTYNGTLCKGTRLYFSGWIGCPDYDVFNTAANVIFNVKGVKEDGTTELLYSYCPGPIYDGYLLEDGTQKLFAAMTYGSYGFWQQVYFSFIDDSESTYASYLLEVDNACTNSAGGDIYIDDIEMYASQPTFNLANQTPVCDQQVTLTKMTSDFMALLTSLGLDEAESAEDATDLKIWYCLLDKDIFDQLSDGLFDASATSTQSGGFQAGTEADIVNAFKTALVGNPNSTVAADRAFRSIGFSNYYEGLQEFTFADAVVTDGPMVRRQTINSVRNLVVSDKISGTNLEANHEYYIVYVPRYGSETISLSNAADAFQIASDCCIMTSFKTLSTITFINDGDDQAVNDSEASVCAGKSISVSAQINGTDITTGELVSQRLVYDWWLDFVGGSFSNAYMVDGQLKVYTDEEMASVTDLGTSVREVLSNFRHFYPNAVNTADCVAQTDTEQDYTLTDEMIAFINTLTLPVPDTMDEGGNVVTKGRSSILFLHATTLSVQLPEGLADGAVEKVTLVPIQQTTEDVVYCYEPQAISIKINGRAPSMYNGFNTATYPSYMGCVPIRTDRSFLAKATTTGGQYLRVPLRAIKTVTAGATGLAGVTATTTDGTTTYVPLYVSATNDIDCEVYEETSSGMYFREIGKVAALSASTKEGAEEPYATFVFDDDFTVRDGYTYTVRFDFTETFDAGDEPEEKNCDGALSINLRIVPEYVLWTGGTNTDWTNDKNWKRADRSELLFDDATETAYVSNEANGTDHSFIPLRTTHVLVAPTDNAPTLYELTKNSDQFLVFPGATQTTDVEYDLLTDNATDYVDCVRYRTYEAKDLTLQSKAEMMNAHLLTYDKAWMEYALTADRWYTLGSPLTDTYAGDWYAPTDGGKQLTPYFHATTFSTDKYDRFSPAVYQRSWDRDGKATIYELDGTTRDVFVKAMWSSVYNDASVQYSTGGFSVKPAAKGKSTTYTDFLFRLPKEDTSYTYYTEDKVTGQAADATTARTSAGSRLIVSEGFATADAFTQTVTNTVAANEYFLVSNPFPCALNLNTFFAENTQLEAKYWLLTANGQTAAIKNADNWTTVNAAAGAADPSLLAAGQGFFVKATAAQAGGALTVKFTKAMMSLAAPQGVELQARSLEAPFTTTQPTKRTLRIRATRGMEQTEAVIVKTAEAVGAYTVDEDLQLLADQLQAAAPTVYTLAGTQAASVNVRPSMYRVPLGVVSSNDDMVRLTFSGLSEFDETLSLLDDANGTVYPLTLAASADTASVEIVAGAAGRYFLLSSEAPTADDELTDAAPVIIAAAGRVTISANAAHPLTYVQIVDADGRTLYKMTPYQTELSLPLPVGAYVVKAETATRETTSKVIVQ